VPERSRMRLDGGLSILAGTSRAEGRTEGAVALVIGVARGRARCSARGQGGMLREPAARVPPIGRVAAGSAGSAPSISAHLYV